VVRDSDVPPLGKGGDEFDRVLDGGNGGSGVGEEGVRCGAVASSAVGSGLLVLDIETVRRRVGIWERRRKVRKGRE
jgi:hypothetical protein